MRIWGTTVSRGDDFREVGHSIPLKLQYAGGDLLFLCTEDPV